MRTSAVRKEMADSAELKVCIKMVFKAYLSCSSDIYTKMARHEKCYMSQLTDKAYVFVNPRIAREK